MKIMFLIFIAMLSIAGCSDDNPFIPEEGPGGYVFYDLSIADEISNVNYTEVYYWYEDGGWWQWDSPPSIHGTLIDITPTYETIESFGYVIDGNISGFYEECPQVMISRFAYQIIEPDGSVSDPIYLECE